MKYPSADVLANNKERRLAIECKTTKEKVKYLQHHEVEQLKKFSEIFGAESWIAVKFYRTEWFFTSLEDLEKKSNSYSIDIELMKKKGLVFEELVE